MTKQSQMEEWGATPRSPGKPVAGAPMRVAIRLWGYDAALAEAWIESFPSVNGTLACTLALTASHPDADLVLHMVKPSGNLRSGFCWNCVGANRALAHAHSAQRNVLALFEGHATQLPVVRNGLWIATGALPPHIALFRLAPLIAAATGQSALGTVTLRTDLLAMIARELDVE
jgi:hypothetical protein